MSRFTFPKGVKLLLISFILFSFLSPVQPQTYCSAYCSYFYQANSYTPMCTGPGIASCTKCDDSLFILVNTTCKPHGYFNESLQFTELYSPVNLTANGWINTTNLALVNTRPGGYELLEFYTGSAPGSGGDDRIYKVFQNLPAHYSVRLRFFVLRSSSSGVSLDYWIDQQKFHYDTSVFPASSTLGDIVTSDKIFHQAKNLTITFEGKLTALNEFIGIKEVLIFVSKCSTFCQFCDSSQNCVKCVNNINSTQTYLMNGYCYEECPETRFSNNSLATCDKCQPQCRNCLYNSTYCTHCISEGKYATFLYNNTCHYTCPDGFFKNYDTNECSCPVDGFFVNSSHKCTACAEECNSCFGPDRNMCYNCTAGSYLVYMKNECTKTCPAGQYGDEFAKKCEICSPLCSQCEGESSKCKACFLGSTLRYLYNQQCVVECPRGYGRNLNLRKCEICPPFYYSYKGECLLVCPDMYVPNNESKSCLYIGETNYSIEPRVVTIDLLPDGKALKFQLSFPQGLTESSKNWISLESYYNVTLKKNGVSLLPKSVSLESDYSISLIFPLTEEINESTQFTIEFANQMNTTKSLNYAKKTKTFKVSEYPQFLADYFKNGSKSFFHIMMVPIILALAILIALRLRGTYELFMETIRLFQFAGLAVFLHYPMEGPIYSLLQGFNYFNLQFFPNIYNWFVPKFGSSLEEEVFSGFSFIYGDMDFIRMIGSILVFVAFWIVIIVVLKCFIIKNVEVLGWLLRVGMDLVEIKIMHSFWNSVIFTFANSQKENIYMLWVHFASYIFMGAVGLRYYKIYESNGSVNYSFLWRLFSTLFISIAIFNKMTVLIFLTLVSVGVGLRHFYSTRDVNKELQAFKFGIAFAMKDFVIAMLPFLSIMAICMISFYREQMKAFSVIITLGVFTYLLIVLEIVIFILIRYFFIRRQRAGIRNEEKQNRDENGEYNKVEQHGTLSSVSESFNEDNESYIKDEFTADFANAHRNTIPDELSGTRIENESKIRVTVERTLISSTGSKIEEPSQRVGEDLKVEQTGNIAQTSKLYPQPSKANSIQSDHDEELFEEKMKRAHRTEALKRRVEPLQTLSIRKQSETEFQHITLKKVENDNESDKINKQENKQENEKSSDRERINLSQMTKKPSKKAMRGENGSSPGLKAKPSYVREIRGQSQNSKISTEQPNIFVNEDYPEQQ